MKVGEYGGPRRMKILFYLPVVTPWWFDRIVARLIRACATDAEVHVIVPPVWRNTGIGIEQLMNCADLEQVNWHIWDREGHEALRTSAADDAELLALIDEIDADYTICRSADVDTPKRFPGKVRFVMEGAVSMVPCPGGWWAMLDEHVLEHGDLPAIDAELRERLEKAVEPLWDQLRADWERRSDPAGRAAFCEQHGIPPEKRIIAMPLEYEHHENFFGIHRRHGGNADFVREIAERLDDRFVLAVTNHPLNIRHLNNRKLHRALDKLGDRVRLIPELEGPRSATDALLPYSDGLVIGDSKAIAIAAYYGVPTYRRSSFRTADWMQVYDDFDAFAEDIANGTAKVASRDTLKLWLAHHIGNRIIEVIPDAFDLTTADVIDYIENPVSAARTDAAPERFERLVAAMEAEAA